MAPNTFVPYVRSGETLDADFNSWQEGKDGASGKPTYAMVTSRSYHAGIVQAAMVDGSVQSFTNEIALLTWRASATRAGDETVESL